MVRPVGGRYGAGVDPADVRGERALVTESQLIALGSLPIFSGMSQRTLKHLLRRTTVDEYPAGVTMIREGAHGDTMFVMLEGTARVVRRGKVVYVLQPGEIFGEFAAIDSRPRTADVIAESPVRALVFGAEDVRKILQSDPKAAWGMLVGVAQRYRLD